MGCLSESPNDKGKGIHPVIHDGFGNAKFKYKKVYPDPHGVQWQELKKILHKKLASGDFKTLWKALAASPTVLSKALTEANLNAAFNSTGAITYERYAMYQRGETKDPSDKLVIMSSNPHFASKLDGAQGQRVLDCIESAAKIVNEHDHIPEDMYLDLLGDADNCPPVTGMQLNRMVVNRQRCCILGDGLFEHRRQLKEAELAAKEASRKRKSGATAADGDDGSKATKKRKTALLCANSGCMKEQGDEKTGWEKCKTKGCRKWFCPACSTQKDAHYIPCHQAFLAKEESKKNTT